MNQVTPSIQNLTRWLLAHESAACQPSDAKSNQVFCVCEKLRGPLSILAGVDGYRALISRALTLAKAEVPSLGPVQVKKDGSLEWTGADMPEKDNDEGTEGEAALVARLLGLLVIFIGEALTLRLVRDIWPDAPME